LLPSERARRERLPDPWLFRAHIIERLIIKPETPNWTPSQLAALRQGHLFQKKGTDVELEKVPNDLKMSFVVIKNRARATP
jgi:hypothetical protein